MGLVHSLRSSDERSASQSSVDGELSEDDCSALSTMASSELLVELADAEDSESDDGADCCEMVGVEATSVGTSDAYSSSSISISNAVTTSSPLYSSSANPRSMSEMLSFGAASEDRQFKRMRFVLVRASEYIPLFVFLERCEAVRMSGREPLIP